MKPIIMDSMLGLEELDSRRWNSAITGIALDERGHAALDFVRRTSQKTHTLTYYPGSFEIEIDGVKYSAESCESILNNLITGSVLLEGSTLGFSELTVALRALKKRAGSPIEILYAEPLEYFKPRRSSLVHRRNFELSEQVQNFSSIPGNVIHIRNGHRCKVVIFTGFEGQRVQRFLEQTGIPPSKCSIVFGVPAFQPGWEMDAFVNNLPVLRESQLSGRVHFCGANNPLSAYMKLEELYAAKGTEERMMVVPVGTKPHGIGTALFACNFPDIGVIYDDPKKKGGRSNHIGKWHLYNVSH